MSIRVIDLVGVNNCSWMEIGDPGVIPNFDCFPVMNLPKHVTFDLFQLTYEALPSSRRLIIRFFVMNGIGFRIVFRFEECIHTGVGVLYKSPTISCKECKVKVMKMFEAKNTIFFIQT
ncbi:hypothetical protein LIER_42161 [Lithospermum erythrorhizon]|uniref:Uncharacterized protein n=1 Tax=Lithospermum erythrorhizon TaxID=34254 RepID=A0AAV3RM50_LITER